MAAGTDKSRWQVGFNPDTGDHVPYVRHGGMIYSSVVRGPIPANFLPATYRFKGTLEVRSYENASSGASIALVDGRARLHYMSLTEFMRHVPRMICGKIDGEWGYAKVGQTTQIVRVGEMS